MVDWCTCKGPCSKGAQRVDIMVSSVREAVSDVVRDQKPYELFNGGAVQVDPGFSQLTPRLLSALETKT